MNVEMLPLAGGFAAGLALGLMFFGGLALTVRRIPHSAHPALLLVASFFARAALLGAGLVFVGRGDWRVMIAALVGLMVMRFVFVAFLRPRPDTLTGGSDGVGGAAS
ncbi:MAG: hypothetical protein GC159_04310 [Phycisphaera sp.]|nr:hypothetical protein [Phycisphaera sp.]